MMKSIFCVIGARPQFIKHSILRSELEKHFNVLTLNTFQHYAEVLHDRVIDGLDFKAPDFNLGKVELEVPARRLTRMYKGIEEVLRVQDVSAVLVYGDTDSTLAGALAASNSELPLIHIEAGERSFNEEMPEETNRVLTDKISDFLVCASHNAITNLEQEGNSGSIFYSGDLLKDLLIRSESLISSPPLPHPYYFASIHRKYTRDDHEKLGQVLSALNSLSEKVVFSLHPSTSKAMTMAGLNQESFPNLLFRDALSYHDSIQYQKFAKAVITDSGGMQKEAYWLKVPCITIRPETEWTETLENSWNQLAYADLDLNQYLSNVPGEHNPSLYGNGQAAQIIAEQLKVRLS